MSSEKELNIGVIGCGHWGPNHIRTFSGLPGARVVMAADPDAKQRARLAGSFKGIEFVADHRAVIDSDEIEAVVISTPTETHYEIARQALEAGKDVLCEKPLTLKYRESIALAELAEKKKRILMVGHIFIYNNGILELRRILQEGVLGQPRYLHSERTNLGPFRSDVNVVYDLASHDIAIFNYLLDSRPTRVTAAGMSYLQDGVEDMAFITMYYPNNIIANCHVSWLHPRKIRELTIVGSAKMITWNDLSATGPLAVYAKNVKTDQYYDDFGHFNLLIKEGDITIPHVPMQEPLKQQDSAFLTAVQKREQPVSDGRFAADIVAVLEAANQSIQRNGESVQIEH